EDSEELADRTPEELDLAAPRDPSAAAADCCATGGAGCSDLVAQECVCDSDPYCCNVGWDSLCVSEVDSLGCGTCSQEVACCEASSLPGCELPSTAACVCNADPYCCANQWDSICVAEVESLGCGTCDPVDLVITELTTPAQACLGQDIGALVSLDVTNDGSDAISSTVGVAWYLSPDAFWGSGDRLLLGGRDQIVGGMAGGSTASVSINANQIPSTATTGTQYLLAVVDELGVVSERDELNNVSAQPIEITTTCPSPLSWLEGFGATSYETLTASAAVTTDTQGNIYVVGSTSGAPIDLGQGPEPTQALDGFIVGYDAEGNYRWSRLFSGVGFDRAVGVSTDSSDRVYVLLESEAALDAGTGLTPLAGARDVLVAAYDSNGAPQWTNRYGAAGATLLGGALASNGAGDMVAISDARGPTVDFGGGSLPTGGSTDAVIFSLDSGGAHRFSRRLAGPDDDHAMGVDINAAGEVLVVGGFSGIADYGTGVLTSAGSTDGLILQLDASGVSQWSDTFGGSGIDFAHAALLDDSGAAYVAGNITGTATVGGSTLTASGTTDVVLLGYGASGVPTWQRQDGGTGLDYPRGLAMSTAGDLVLTGSFFGTTANYADHSAVGAGGYDIVLAGYRPTDGVGLWAETYGSTAIEQGYDVAASPTGSVVIAGEFTSTFSAHGTALSSAGGTDIFVLSTVP
ncbi:MAG: SBBP repeat-containing protein, partial [Nannocystaceae bacterium]|nr:SBBP repeat-containing protein [Nannocystaceae bacterium]